MCVCRCVCVLCVFVREIDLRCISVCACVISFDSHLYRLYLRIEVIVLTDSIEIERTIGGVSAWKFIGVLKSFPGKHSQLLFDQKKILKIIYKVLIFQFVKLQNWISLWRVNFVYSVFLCFVINCKVKYQLLTNMVK